MKHFVLALIVAAFSIGPGHGIAAEGPDWRARYALDYVCDYLMLDCTGLDAPQLVFVDSVSMFGFKFYGAYSTVAHKTIFLDWSIQWESRHLTQTVVHEMVHYVDFERIFRSVTHCEREALAFMVMNAWAVENDMPPDLGWYVRYGCSADIQVSI